MRDARTTAEASAQPMISDVRRIVDRHLEAYGEPDAARRESLISEVWAVDGELIDPPFEGSGRAGINELAAALQSNYPGHTFRRTTGIDHHHSFARYEWELVDPNGGVALSGLDIAEIGDDGLLRRVVGFIGPISSDEV